MVIVAVVLRVLLALVILRAGLAKISDRRRFRDVVGDYELLPARAVPMVATTLPPAEALTGVVLLVGVVVRPAALVIVGMLVCFSVAVAINLGRGRHVECGCYGRVSSTITWRHVAANGVLIGAGAFAAAFPAQPLVLASLWETAGGRLSAQAVPALAAVLVALAAAAAGALVRYALAVLARSHALRGRLAPGERT